MLKTNGVIICYGERRKLVYNCLNWASHTQTYVYAKWAKPMIITFVWKKSRHFIYLFVRRPNAFRVRSMSSIRTVELAVWYKMDKKSLYQFPFSLCMSNAQENEPCAMFDAMSEIYRTVQPTETKCWQEKYIVYV